MLEHSPMNAIELLKEQHDKVQKVLKRMSEGAPANSEQVRQLADELVAHMVIEEHIFYPRIKELMKDTIQESFEEHAVARFELARLLQATGTDKKTRALVLKELLEHHIEEEEEEMFPKVRKEIAAEDLVALGVEMKAAFEKAVANGYASFFPSSSTKPRERRQAAPVAHAR